MSKVKIGLMLGGGGAKGSYQLGIIRALVEAKWIGNIKTISGTSIGAINTLLLMSKLKVGQMRSIWQDIDNSKVFATKGKLFNKESNRMYSLQPLAETLISKIDQKTIKKSKYKGFATSALMYSKNSMLHQISTDTMEKKVWHLNKMKTPYLGVMASASIPVVFGPTEIDGLNYVDGGVLDNHPIDPLLNEGCNLIFAVPLDNRFKPELYDDKNITIVNFAAKTVFESNILKDLLDTIKFDSDFKEEKEELGYLVGKLMVKKLKKLNMHKKTLLFDKWQIKEGFNLIQLDEADELKVKEYKKQLHVRDEDVSTQDKDEEKEEKNK